MLRLRIYFALAVLFMGVNKTMAQHFYNLTAEEVSIGQVLPSVARAIPLTGQYNDSVYTVSVEYPEFIDMSKADIARYRALSQEKLPEMPTPQCAMVVERKKAALEVTLCPLVYRNGKYQMLVSYMLRVTAAPKAQGARRAPTAANERYASHSVLAEGRWAKISIPTSGVFQITDDVAKKAGFTDAAHVKVYGYGGALQNEKLTEEDLIKYDDLKEVPQYVSGGKHLFYANGPVSWADNKNTTRRTRNPYSVNGYYLITEGEPTVVDSIQFVGNFYPSPSDYHTLHEVDNFAWFEGGRNLFENTPVETGKSYSYTLSIPEGNSNGTLHMSVSAGAASRVNVTLNDSVVGTLNMTLSEYDKGKVAAASYQVGNLKAENTVTITVMSGGPVRLDYADIFFPSPRREPQLSTGAFPAAEYVYNITNQDLHAHGPADMVMIIPTSQHLLSQAQRLADFHAAHDQMRVRIVPADELFNEFASGTPDANAYRRYLKMLYDRAESYADMPKYLLLFGDCVWDNRMLTSTCRNYSPDDFLLCFESENSMSKTDCYVDDGFFCLLDDGEGTNPQSSDKLDMAVGRFPVRNNDEAKTLVDKTIAYVTNDDNGAWQNTVMFLADDGNANTHMADVEAVAAAVENSDAGFYIKRVYWDAYDMQTSATGNSYPDVEKIIKQQQAEGALIIDYGGHGSEVSISHEKVLQLIDFQNFTNTRYPLWVTASCDIMPFDGAAFNIGEEALLNKKGGTMAFYGTTRTVWINKNPAINKAFITYALSLDAEGKPITIGDAQRMAKNYLITSKSELTTNKLQYSLLGDPAITLHRPYMTIVVDSINGQPVNSETFVNLKAGSTAKIGGHVEWKGVKQDDFNGKVEMIVRDTKQKVVCKLNQPQEASTPYTFYDRPNVLFNGSDSVRNGRFNFAFAVPMDINYSDGTGLMTIYAAGSDHVRTAHGSFEQFSINGTEKVANDSIGPSLYCYLNSPSFTDGGQVNTTPFFVAQVTDKDGINASGTGIGHDMELVIDGEMNRTYVLNDNFTFDFGSYTSGQTFYNIPELEPGMHKLTFKAWDILNNATTAQLTFIVVKGLKPTLYSVDCTNNPATTSTTFIINHDRNGSTMDVEIDVYDLSGRLLWRHDETGVATSGAYTVDWDLTVDGGHRLQTGVYLYRARVATDGSSKASKAKKLIIIGNK